MGHSDKNMVTEAAEINARTSIPTTPKAEDTTTRMNEQTIGIDDTNRSVVTVNVTAKPDDDNVTKITIDPVHHSVHASSQGQQPLMNEQEETQGEIPITNRCVILTFLPTNILILKLQNTVISS